MAGHGEKLPRKMELALAALLAEPSVEAAAARAGVSERTLRLWLKLPEFDRAYRRARAEVLERTTAQLLRATGKAVTALEKALKSRSVNTTIRSAVAILNHATRGVEVLDLAGQVEELRQEVERIKDERRDPQRAA
jgi:hypothetical protein